MVARLLSEKVRDGFTNEESMSRTPETILCQVVKKSQWQRPGDKGLFKSISLDLVPGRYFALGDETQRDYEYLTLSISASASVPCFFDSFEVGQKVELEVKPISPIQDESK